MSDSTPVSMYWDIKLQGAKKALEANGFAVSIHDTLAQAAFHVRDAVMPQVKPQSVGFGGSMTIAASGILDLIRANASMGLIDAADPSHSPEQVLELRRQMFLTDLYLSSSNALTMDGKLVNRDLQGNRVGAIHYGPRKVVLMITRNKICETVEDGIQRIKAVAGPMNAMRLGRQTPCVKTGVCVDCKSPDRICSVWTITEKCWPLNRIHVLLVNEEGGF